MSRVKKPDQTWQERAKNVLAQNETGTNSKRSSQFVEGVYPSHTNGHGSGCFLFDTWGNKYIDFILALELSRSDIRTSMLLRQYKGRFLKGLHIHFRPRLKLKLQNACLPLFRRLKK